MSGTNGSGNGDHDGHDHDGHHHGGHEHDHEGHEHEPVAGEMPAEIIELAESCRQFTLSALGFELDYDPETLPVLDEYLKVASAGVADRPEALPLVARAVSAYFGEVVRRRIDGFWRHVEDATDPWQLCARRAYVAMSPFGIVLETLAKNPEHDGPSGKLRLSPDDEQLAEERLARIPPVSEDEYYMLATRLEVIETVYETLRDQMKAEGRESLVFEESDYEED